MTLISLRRFPSCPSPVPVPEETVLGNGEAGLYASNVLEIGDGITMWKDLPAIGSIGIPVFNDEGDSAPTSGVWALGWRRRNTSPTAGGIIGWVNLVEGGCNFKEWGIINA